MSIFNIPVQNRTDANRLTVELSGVFYELRFLFNGNESLWYMSLIKNSIEIVSGIKLVSGDNLLSQFRAYDVPDGRLYIEDQDGKYADPGEFNFGESVFLRYDDEL